jgi:transposase-like protein
MSDIQNPIFTDDELARQWLEARMWPDGPVCPHCGTENQSTKLTGKAHRPGVYQCNACRKQFSVTVGTLFERSKIPLSKWLMATYLLCASKKGMSTRQLSRMLGVSVKSTWFMTHRIREAMRPGSDFGPLGGKGKIVEADETLIGGKERNKHKSKRNPKNIGAVGKEITFSLIERGGKVRSYHVPAVNADTLRPIMVAHIDRKSFLMTDDAGQYRPIGPEFAGFDTVNHGIEEYVRGAAHVNTTEGYFSLLKRGLNGTYHHVSQQHLKRYLAEFDFRYNERTALGISDIERTKKALKGIAGKRMTYRRPRGGGHPDTSLYA